MCLLPLAAHRPVLNLVVLGMVCLFAPIVVAQPEGQPLPSPSASAAVGGSNRVLLSFESWAHSYVDCRNPERRAELHAQGIGLAKDRRAALASLIRTNPHRALEASLSAALRESLPLNLQVELETPFSGMADLSVVGLLQADGGPEVEPIQKFLRINGKTYRAYTGADALTETTRNVPVRGIAIDSMIAVEPTGPAEPPVRPAGVQASRRVLILRVDFPDLSGDPGSGAYTADYVQDVMDNQVVPFFQRSSYGRVGVSYTVSPNVYRLPQTALYYATADIGYQLSADARIFASRDYNLSEYDSVAVVFSWLGNLPGSLITYGGMSEINGGNIWVNGEFDFRVMAHELGHNCGLWHANLWQVNDGNPVSNSGVNLELGDPFDVMGANRANDLRVDYNPWFKYLLGWLRDDQVQTVVSNGTYRINPFDYGTGLGCLALRVQKDGARNYWIGCRRNLAENNSLSTGAYVIWGYNTRRSSHLLDASTPGSNVQDAALALGTTLVDLDAGLTITPVCGGGVSPDDYLDVEVAFGLSDPCVAQGPEDQAVSAGQAAVFAVTATGNPSPTFQWQFKTAGSSVWSNVRNDARFQGAATAALLVNDTTVAMDGVQVRCLLTGLQGHATLSSAATLSVIPSPSVYLEARRVGSFLVLSWTAPVDSYVLESSLDLTAGQAWTAAPNEPSLVGGVYWWTNQSSADPIFFRLRRCD